MLSVMSTLTQSRPAAGLISTDLVVFCIRSEALQLLLRTRSRSARSWLLPGGYAQTLSDLDCCAEQTLAAQTGLHGVYMEQLYTFGAGGRPSADQVVTVAYYALVAPEQQLKKEFQGTAWFPWSRLPVVPAEQKKIITLAYQRMAAKLDYSTIAFELMPETFTLSELQGVYETVLGVSLDKRNFRKRILGLRCIEPTGQQRRNGSHRPAQLYRHSSNGQIQYLK